MINELISVVLPVYNGEKYLAQSIESVVNQTYKKWELIIINDCSIDHSLQIAQEYANSDSRIKVYTNEKNLKLPRSLNAGFEKASGKYYTWTSDDNLYKPEALEILVKELESDSETVMAYTDMDIIDYEGKLIGHCSYIDEPYRLCLGNCCGACFMYRSDAAQNVGKYNIDYYLAEDYNYWIRLYKYGKIKYIHNNLYYYRQHPDSLSETRQMEIIAKAKQLIDENFDFLHRLACDNNIEYEFFENVLWRCKDDRERKQYRNKCFKISKKYFMKKLFLKIKGIFN